MYKLSFFDKISFVLVLLGALNWGIIGIAGINLLWLLLGNLPLLARIIYICIGVSAVNLIILIYRSGIIGQKNR